jgi:hypothetical protein
MNLFRGRLRQFIKLSAGKIYIRAWKKRLPTCGIAAFLFVWFLEKNGILYRADGSKKIADNALVALTLMIAESKPEEKDMMIKVVVNLINLRN